MLVDRPANARLTPGAAGGGSAVWRVDCQYHRALAYVPNRARILTDQVTHLMFRRRG